MDSQSDPLLSFFLANGGEVNNNLGYDPITSGSGNNNRSGQMMMMDQNDSSSYPLLLQHYLNQQQQELSLQQQMPAPSVMDNNGLGGFSGMPDLMGPAHMGYDNNPSNMGMMQDRFNSWGCGPTNMSGGPQVAAASSQNNDQFTPNLMMYGAMQNGPKETTFNPNNNSSRVVNSLSSQMGVGNTATSSFMNNSAAASHSSPVRDIYAEQGILGPWSERAAGLLGSMFSSDPTNQEGKVKRSRRKQPKDKPKRPLSAYNIFFKEERARLLSSDSTETAPGAQKRTANGKIGFENLAKIIGGKWQDLGPNEVEYYKNKAASDMARYKKEMEGYKRQKETNERTAEEQRESHGELNQDEDQDEDNDDFPTPKKQRKL